MAVLHIVPKFVGYTNEEYQASFWLETNTTPAQSDIPEILMNVTDWLQDMYDAVIAITPTVISAIEYTIYIYDLLTGLESFFADGGWTFLGTGLGQGVTPQVAATLSAPGLGSDRPGQKRMIPLNEAVADRGVMSAAAVTAYAAFGAQWVSLRPASLNFTYAPGYISQGPPRRFTLFSGAVFVRENLGTVRSRKRGVGI